MLNWNNIFSSGRDFTASQMQINKILSLVDTAKDCCLDIGCGTGQLTKSLFLFGFKNSIGIDTSEDAIFIASSCTKKDGIKFIPIKNLVIFLESYNKKFDLITIRYSFSFIENKNEVLNLIHNLMNSGSEFIIINPNYEKLTKNKKHISEPHLETKLKLRKFFLVDFQEDELDYFFICRKI